MEITPKKSLTNENQPWNLFRYKCLYKCLLRKFSSTDVVRLSSLALRLPVSSTVMRKLNMNLQ